MNRLGTLTYAGSGCHDAAVLRSDVAEFFRSLRDGLGGLAFPYLWTSEWHKTGHGLHVHFAVGRFIKRSLIEESWGRGFVHIKLLGDMPVGSGSLGEARRAATYLAKYVGKDLDQVRQAGLHRYEVAEGFQPRAIRVAATRHDEAVRAAAEYFGGRPPERVWSSGESHGWAGPPAVWLSWG